MEIKQSGSQPSSKGPAEWFCGEWLLIRCLRGPNQRVFGGERYIPAGCSHGLAHPSARSDVDRHVRPWTGAALGRRNRGDQARRRGLVFTG
jgi:hypothetical protein